MIKICPRCQKEFATPRHNTKWCPDCRDDARREQKSEYMREYRAAHPEYMREYRAANRERYREYQRRYRLRKKLEREANHD